MSEREAPGVTVGQRKQMKKKKKKTGQRQKHCLALDGIGLWCLWKDIQREKSRKQLGACFGAQQRAPSGVEPDILTQGQRLLTLVYR